MSNQNLQAVYDTVIKDFPEYKDSFGTYEDFQKKMLDPENAEQIRKLLRSNYSKESLGDSATFSNNIKFSPNDIKESEEDISKKLIETAPEKLLGDELININENQTEIIEQETIEQSNFDSASEVIPEIEELVIEEDDFEEVKDKDKSPLDVTLDTLIQDIDLKSDIGFEEFSASSTAAINLPGGPPEKEDGIIIESLKDTVGMFEIPLAIVTGLVGEGTAGIAGLLERTFSGKMDPEDLEAMMREISAKIAYQPRSSSAEEGLQIISYPFEKLHEAATAASEIVNEYTDSPLLSAITQTGIEGSVFLIGPLRAKYIKSKNQYTGNRNKRALAINEIAEKKMGAKLMNDLLFDDVIINNISLDGVMKKYKIPSKFKPNVELMIKKIKNEWDSVKPVSYEVVGTNALKPPKPIDVKNIGEVKVFSTNNPITGKNEHAVKVIGKDGKILDVIEDYPTLEAAHAAASEFMTKALLVPKSTKDKPTQSYYDEKLDKIVEVKDKEVIEVVEDLKLSAEDKKKLKDTKVSDESGAIKVYHGTTENFDIFDLELSRDIGAHLGSKEQAKDRIRDRDTNRYPEGSNIRGHYIDIKNPLYLEDLDNWYPDDISAALKEQGFKNVPEFGPTDQAPEHFKALREYLQNEGYDGIIYNNKFEGGDIRSNLIGKDLDYYDATFMDFIDQKAWTPEKRIKWLLELEKKGKSSREGGISVTYNKGDLANLSYIVFDPKKQIFGYETTLKKPLKERKKPKEEKPSEPTVLQESKDALNDYSSNLNAPKRLSAKNNEIVIIDISKADKLFSKDKGYYLSKGEYSSNEGVSKTIETRGDMEAPIVSFVGKGDNLFMSFTDGRHRFSQLRDAGAKSIALSMSPESAEIARNMGLEKIIKKPPHKEKSVYIDESGLGSSGYITMEAKYGKTNPVEDGKSVIDNPNLLKDIKKEYGVNSVSEMNNIQKKDFIRKVRIELGYPVKPTEEVVVAETLPDKLTVLDESISTLNKKKESGTLTDKEKGRLGKLTLIKSRLLDKQRQAKKELIDKDLELKETTGAYNKKHESIDFQLSSLKAKEKEGKITPSEKLDIRRLEKEKKDLVREQKEYEKAVRKDVVLRLEKTKIDLEKQIKFASRKGSKTTPSQRKELNRKISKVHKLIKKLESEGGISVASEVYGQTYSTIIPPSLIHIFKLIERKIKIKGKEPFTDADIEHIDYVINQSGDIVPNNMDINNKNYVRDEGHRVFLNKIRKRKLEIAKSNKEVMEWNKLVKDELDRYDIGAYVEGIGNILIEGDTFADVKKRMTPEKLRVLKEYKNSIERARVDINGYLKEITGADKDYISFLENYLPHFYTDVNGKGFSLAIDKLKDSKNAKQRKLPTLEDAIEAGLTPKSQDPGTLYNLYSTLNWTMATNKMFSHELHKIITPDGNRAVIPNIKGVEHPPEYIYYNHPILNRAYSMPKKNGDILESHDGVWVHPDLKKPLDMLKKYSPYDMSIEGTSKFWKIYDKTNAASKTFSLGFSLFHHIALTESAQAVLANKNPIRGIFLFGEKHPITGKRTFGRPHKTGMELMNDEKYFEDAMMHGLQISHPSMDNHSGTWEQIKQSCLSNTTNPRIRSAINKTFDNTVIGFQNLLWNNYHSGLKMFSYYDIVSKNMELYPKLSSTDIKEMSAKLINDAFGGQEWESKLILGNPDMKKLLSRILLSPDWTYSNAMMGYEGLGSQIQKISSGKFNFPGSDTRFKDNKYSGFKSKFYRNYWKNLALTIGGTSALFQYAVYQAFGDEDKGDIPYTWNNEKGKKFHIDITPLLRATSEKLGNKWTTKQRYYSHFGKQAFELQGYVKDLYGPLNTFKRKASPLVQFGYELATGKTTSDFQVDWRKENATWIDMGIRSTKVFIPFGFQGNSLVWTLPVAKGMTPYKAREEVLKVINAYVDPHTKQRIINKYSNEKLEPIFGKHFKNYETEFSKFFPDLFDALKNNGHNPESVLKDVVSGLTAQYNNEFIDIATDDKGNWKNPEQFTERERFLTEYAAYKLVKLNKGYETFVRSLQNKRRTGKIQATDSKQFEEIKRIWSDAFEYLPNPLTDPDKWVREAMDKQYFTKYQKDIINMTRVKRAVGF